MLDLKNFIPKISLTGTTIKAIINSETITLKSMSNPQSKITIRRFINPTEKFWIGLGLYEAEKTGVFTYGKEKRIQGYKVAFTNQNPKIISCILEMFETIGIKRNSWKGEIGTNIHCVQKEKFEEKTPVYWAKQLKMPLKNFRYFRYDKRKPKRIYKYKRKFHGILTLYQFNLCLKSFLNNFTKRLLNQ